MISELKKIVFFLSAGILLATALAYASYEDYFTFERFDKEYNISNLRVIGRKIPFNLDRIRESMNAFSFSLQFIKQRDYAEAKNLLRRSVKYWPEFLPGRFTLALLYEETGDKRGAFNEYKIYLSLLQKLHQNKINTTKVLLALLEFEEFETYEQAYNMISERLKEHRMLAKLKYSRSRISESQATALDKVFKNPYIVRFVGLIVAGMVIIGIFGEGIIPDKLRTIFLLLLVPVVVIAILWFTYTQTANKIFLIFAYLVYPVSFLLYIGKGARHAYWLKHRKPQAGCWICKNCGAENLNIYKECVKCSFEK